MDLVMCKGDRVGTLNLCKLYDLFYSAVCEDAVHLDCFVF